jgi:hypothetical protein
LCHQRDIEIKNKAKNRRVGSERREREEEKKDTRPRGTEKDL